MFKPGIHLASLLCFSGTLLTMTSSASADPGPFGSADSSSNSSSSSSSSAAASNRNEEEQTSFIRAPAPQRRWYGYQTLMADGLSLGVLGLGLGVADGKTTRLGLLVTGMVSYYFASPIIHAAHGHWGKFGGDIGLRFSMAGVFSGIGAAIGAASYDDRGGGAFDGLGRLAAMIVGAIYGTAIGMAGAITIDAAVIAREDVPKPSSGQPPTAAQRSHVTILPTITPTHAGASAGIAGTF